MQCVVSAGIGAALVLFAATVGAQCRGAVYLTLDTGNMSQADTIARILNEEDVRATFFLANERTFRDDYSLDPSWDGYWRARAREGHAFGNHTWAHRTAQRDDAENIVMRGDQTPVDRAGFCADLKKVADAFERTTGQRLSGLWRAPGGRTTQNTIRYAASCGYPIHVHWSDAGFLGDELPSETHSNARLLEQALKNVRPGDILMMHLGIWSRKDPYAPTLKSLIRGLKARGLCFDIVPGAAR